MPFKFNLFSALVALFFLLAVTSCHKSNDTPSPALVGNWNFVYLTTDITAFQMDSTVNVKNTLRAVSTSQYTTTQNTGTVVFTKDSALVSGLGYAANANVTVSEYVNGVLTGSTTHTQNASVPSSSSSSNYQLIGKDSIYLAGGGLLLGGIPASTVTLPTGGHYALKGDSLIITSVISQVTTAPPGNGHIQSSGLQANVVIVMKKQ